MGHETYDEKRFKILPDGVVSKNDIGLRKIFMNN